MKRNFRITVDGRSYNVAVEDLDVGADPTDALTIAPATASPSTATAAAVPPLPPAAPAGPGSIVAPLGGIVVSIDVPLGRNVAVGDKVATIEAMKMKTSVVSKFAGKVTNIAAKANESVETGQVLMSVE